MLTNKTILITGGTGSFGHAFIPLALKCNPRKVIVFSRDELKQAQMAETLTDERLRFFIGDIRDRDRLYRAFEGVDIIIHAAALKRVESGEYNPAEVIKTNIIGCMNLIDAAIDRGVQKIIGLSTDKAVNPVNLYGASKLCAEKLLVAGNAYAGAKPTRFSVVRYGNVLASRGSVIQLWREQAATGKITLTDERMTRFWLRVEEAANFVLMCLLSMRGGEVFVPKVSSMRLTDLAEAVAPGCERVVIGIRPGEKLHELLISADEACHTYEAPHCYVITPQLSMAHVTGGDKVPEGFCYSSDRNDRWLTVEQLRGMV